MTVRVTDQGRGIPSQQRARVFEPFFRGARRPTARRVAARPARATARGWGWRSAAGFVEANGGRILLQSGGQPGTSFAVSFPVARQPAAAGS